MARVKVSATKIPTPARTHRPRPPAPNYRHLYEVEVENRTRLDQRIAALEKTLRELQEKHYHIVELFEQIQ